MYYASSLNTLFALILWHTWININFTRQHAFRKKHNCETQMITVTNNKAKILKKDGQVDTSILDFKKGFDTPHPHELHKCNLYGYCIDRKTEMG